MIDLKYTTEYNPEHWFRIHKCFDDSTALTLLSFFPEEAHFSETGKRDGANKFRTFAKKDTPLGDMFKDFADREFRIHLSDITSVNCTEGELRVELCQDGPGFYLEPHIDISEKVITLQIYLDQGNEDWGTSLYTQAGTYYETVPFVHNTGWMSTMNSPLIHGVEQNIVDGIRKSVIINYVVGNWRDKEQLYDYASSPGDDIPQHQEEQET